MNSCGSGILEYFGFISLLNGIGNGVYPSLIYRYSCFTLQKQLVGKHQAMRLRESVMICEYSIKGYVIVQWFKV